MRSARAGPMRGVSPRTSRRFTARPSDGSCGSRPCASSSTGASSWSSGCTSSTTARSHPYFAPFAEHFLEALADIRSSLLTDRSFEGTAGYFALLRRYLASREVPFDGTPLHGLQVLGALETRGLRFDRVFVLDANEGRLPAVSRDDPLLPQPVRRALGLPTTRERELAARHHFDELVGGCRELHLFSVDDGTAEPSRFVERLLWERQREAGILDGASLASHVHYRTSLASTVPSPVAKTPEVAARLSTLAFSASGLDAYLACPLRFYYSRVLGLRERDEVTGEVDRLEIGTVAHEAISAFLAPFEGAAAIDPDALDPGAMDAIALARFRAHFGDPSSGALRVVAAQVRARLREMVSGWLRPLAARTRLAGGRTRAVPRGDVGRPAPGGPHRRGDAPRWAGLDPRLEDRQRHVVDTRQARRPRARGPVHLEEGSRQHAAADVPAAARRAGGTTPPRRGRGVRHARSGTDGRGVRRPAVRRPRRGRSRLAEDRGNAAPDDRGDH